MKPYRRIRSDIRALVRNLGVLQPRYPELGLGVTQCHALLELQMRQLSLGELGERLQIDDSTASRNLDTLERHGLVRRHRDADDPRKKLHQLSPKGRRKLDAVHARGDRVVAGAFAYLTPPERATVAAGLELFARSLARAQPPAGAAASARGVARAPVVAIRPSSRADNPAIARLIRTVLAELGQANPGTAYYEAATDRIHDVYREAKGRYLVVTRDGRVAGGAGILPHARRLCELKNMYFLPSLRGGGHARRLMNELLRFARARGFREVFLETYSGWTAAIALYEAFGFTPARLPARYRGHALCDRAYRLLLD